MHACCWTSNAGPRSCRLPPCNEGQKERSCMWSTPTERWACDRSRSGSPILRRYPSMQVWLPKNSSWLTALKNCEKALRWKSRTKTAHPQKAEPISRPQGVRSREEERGREPVPSLHPASSGDSPVHGCHSPCRIHRLSAATGFGPSPSRLPHHSGAHLLSWRESGRDGFFCHRAIGAPIRTDAG